ncbi:DUF6383 domain-containing protein [Parabacteroides johnsonii]|uniref:DUF6383 domain-containing protein n=1 Tax=Parabacteroides johnsonii TaxID=387661 RepID=UPI00266D86F4|nr:DUF6383 domain-containing protein [Parabacteroides johnsonii]
MNKRFSTLVAAFAAIATVSYAQIGDKYVYLKNSTSYLTVTKENTAKADSVWFKAAGVTKAEKDSALWLPKYVETMTSGDSVFQFVNKATQKNLSFAVKKNGADKYGTMIAPGIDKFVFKSGVASGSAIYAAYNLDGKNVIVSLSNIPGELAVAENLDVTNSSAVSLVEVEAPGALNLTTVADLAGKLSSFKFEFKGKDGGIFTATDLIPVPVNGKYRFQVVGQEKSTKGTKKDQYITIDTTMIGSTTSIQVAAFKLDTIVAAGGAQYQGGNEGLQTFKLSMDLGNDSISMTTDSIVRFVNGKYEVAVHGGATSTYIVGYKTFNGAPVLCIDSAAIEAPFITLAKGTPVKLAGGTGVYSLQLKAKGGNTNATYNDKYLVGDGSTPSAAVAAASAYIPSTQFYVKEHEDGTYSIQGREATSISTKTGSNGETYGEAIASSLLLDEKPLYAVDVANGVYHLGKGNGQDTLVFKKLDVDLTNEHIGYKYYTKEEMGYGAVKFNLASAAADDIYLSLVQDSVIAGAKGAEKALELRLVEGAEIAKDTVYYGAQALGDTLVRVAYALEQAYDAEGRLAHENVSGVEVVKLSKDANLQNQRFFFVAGPAEDSYKIVEAMTTNNDILTLNISNLSVTYDEPVAGVETYFNIEGAEAPIYKKMESGHYNIGNGLEMLTASAGVAKMLRVGDELKAASTADDFSLYVDSAYVNRGEDNTEYGYYIYKGAEVKNDTIIGSVLSAKGKFAADAAKGDSAIFRSATIVKDTIAYEGDLKDGKQNKYKVRDAKNTSLVGFKVVEEGGFEIVALNSNKKLAVVNGVVIFSDNVAPLTFTTEATEAPTANEDVEVSEVTVIAGNGNVTVAGAQGKKVVISNILGQTVANTVIASDNATIAAPQGVVVVAVEGEEAVKAIVK